MKKLLPLLGFLLILACGQSSTTDNSKSNIFFHAEQIGEITDRHVSEISGMALSRVHDDVLWMMNDSGDDAIVYAVNKSGDVLSSTLITDAENVDWEDLASFQLDGTSWLLVADVGNNVVPRDTFTLYVIKEPALDQSTIRTSWTITFHYPDGPRDCEAVTVDIQNHTVLLLSKRDVPAVLYQLPLQPPGDKAVAAVRLGDVASIPQPTEDEIESRHDKYHAQPTGLDILPDGSKIAVLTYRRLFLYEADAKESRIVSLSKKPLQIEFPRLEQPEAVCFDIDEKAVLLTTEKIPAPIYRVTVSE